MSSHVVLVYNQAITHLATNAARDILVALGWHANVVLLEQLDNLITTFFAVDNF